MIENNFPITFKIGEGDTIVSPVFSNGILYIKITRNSSDMSFINGQSLTADDNIKFNAQVKQQPEAIFEFKDIDLGLKFYSGFFKEPDQKVIKTIQTLYYLWHLSLCA